MKITLELVGKYWRWSVENDPNSYGFYHGIADTFTMAFENIANSIQFKANHPYNPKVRTEY